MILQVEGIILKARDYKDTSKILDVYVKEKGIIGILSKGCKSMKSPLRSVSEPLIYGMFTIYYKEDKLSILNAVDINQSFKNIKKNIESISYSNFFSELVLQVIKQSDEKEEIYDILIDALKKVDEGFSPKVISNIIQLKMLNFLGVFPNLEECVFCGTTQNIVTIDSNNHGFVCKGCHTNQKLISKKAMQLIRMFNYVDIGKISKLDINEEVNEEISKFLDDYYEKNTGIYLDAKRYIKKLTLIDI